MKAWKRNAVIATVLVFICAGVYLNWSYNQKEKTPELTQTLSAEQVMGETTMVIADTSEEAEPAANMDAADYFAQVRLSRQESRDSAVELLEQTIHSANLKDGVWYLMTQFPEMEYSGPEMGVMQ